MKKAYYPPLYFLLALAAVIVTYIALPQWNVIPFPLNLFGLLLIFTGFGIMDAANEVFLKINNSHSAKKIKALVKSGPFSRTRNPMHIGMVIFTLGFAITFQNLVALVIPILLFAYISLLVVPMEERRLNKMFGLEYVKYRQNVGRWFKF